jgi:hypothetical protein
MNLELSPVGDINLKKQIPTKNMNTPTSGPWRIHRGYENEQTKTITGDDGETWQFTHTYISQGDKIIAEVQHQSKNSGWPHVHDVEEMWANARLIAAAPEMLEALKWAVQQIEDDLDPDHREAMDACLAAISKAEGREA